MEGRGEICRNEKKWEELNEKKLWVQDEMSFERKVRDIDTELYRVAQKSKPLSRIIIKSY